MMHAQHNKGFNLIELVIAITILAIITAFAYPAYLESVRKARRADAKSTLMDYATRLERCFSRANTYAGCGTAPNGSSAEGYYAITVVTNTSTQFTVTAAKQGVQAKDNACATFVIDQHGNRTATMQGGTPTANCW